MSEITFDNFDKFNRKDFAIRLTEVLSKFYEFYDGAYVLSLNAKFGSGKTTFLRMWQSFLKEQGFEVIYINAWETDFDDEPLIPIISALLDNLKLNQKTDAVKNALKTTLGATALATNQVIKHAIGIDIDEIGQRVEKELNHDKIEKVGNEVYREFSFKKDAYKALRKALEEYIVGLDKPLVIIVDELDRVRPDYSVKFLEAIKHIFSIKGVCFVLGVDRDQLQTSIKQLYGDIDFENYYRRFITREAKLPDAAQLDLNPFVAALAREFLENKKSSNINFAYDANSQATVLNFIAIASQAFQFAPRQIEYFFRIFSQFMAVTRPDQKARLEWVKAAIVLIAAFIYEISFYYKLGQGRSSPQEIYSFIKGLNIASQSDERQILLIILAFAVNGSNGKELKEMAKVVINYDGGYSEHESHEAQDTNAIKFMGRIVDDFGFMRGSDSGFRMIFKMLEDWRPFL